MIQAYKIVRAKYYVDTVPELFLTVRVGTEFAGTVDQPESLNDS